MNYNSKKDEDIFSEKKTFENSLQNVKNNSSDKNKYMCNQTVDNTSKQDIQSIENNNIENNECDNFILMNNDFNKKDSNENGNILNNYMIESLCINEIKSSEEMDLFDDKKYTNKDVLISMLRKNLELKIKDYNLIMDTLIRTKEECNQKSDKIKKLKLKHTEMERDYFNLKKENEKINSEKNMNLGNFSFYKNEYKDLKYKLLRLEDKHNAVLEKNAQLNNEITNLKNEKCKLEINKNNEIENLKNENEKLKNKNDQLLNEHQHLLEKYLLTEKKNYELEREKKEEISKLQEIIAKEEAMKKNSVENLNKVKDVLSKSLLKSEENVKKLLLVEKERDNLKMKNENFIKKNEELIIKIDNLKNALRLFEKYFREIIEKNNAMFSVTHEFLHHNNSKIIVLRKNNEIKTICNNYNIEKSIFENINHFSVLYIYEVIHNEVQGFYNESVEDYDANADADEDEDDENEEYIKIKKSEYKSLNNLLNEAQMKIITLSRSNENFEKCCAKVKNTLLSDELNIYKKHYFGDHEYLCNEKNYIENILQEKIEYTKCIEKKIEEKDLIIHKYKENIFKLKLEKETLTKVIYSLPNFSSTVQVDNNNKKFSLEKIVENIVKDYINNMKYKKMEELNEKTPSNISKHSHIQKDNNENINEHNVIPTLWNGLSPFRSILENLGKAILNIEAKQLDYFKKSNLLNFIDDYMITIDIFNRISSYNNLFKVEILLEKEFSYILEKLSGNEENKTKIIIKELESNKKNYNDEELFHYIEDQKILDKYKKFYHDHFVNINNIFNTIISFNLYNIENKYKTTYERYFNLFNLNFSNVEISFDLLLRRFNKILRLSKSYENIIVENNKKISELNKNEMELYKTHKKLEYEIDLMNKEKENLEKVIIKNEEKINKFNENYILLQNEFYEYKNKYISIMEELDNLKKEKCNLEQEISQKDQRNIKLNEQNCEIIKSYEKEKDYLQTLLQETKENNNYLKEKLESILNNNEKLKYDYNLRLNNLNTMWLEEKENNKKYIFNINNLKIENNNLLLKMKELENKNNLIKGELNERIKQINVFRNYCTFTIKDIKNISNSYNSYASNNYPLNVDDTKKDMEYELRERKLQENIADLERENLKLKGEKDMLITSVDTWKCFSVDSKEEINRLKKICNEQLEKHKEFLLINQSNEEKLKYINNLLTTEKDKYEKDLNEIKSSLSAEIEKLSNNLKEKMHEIKVLQYDKETLVEKIKNLEKEKSDEFSLKKKEEEYINLLKNDKKNLQKEFNDILEKHNAELDKNKKLSNEMDLLISKHNEEMRLINEKLKNVKKDNAYLNEIFQKQATFSDNDILKNRLDQLVHINKDLESELQENAAFNEKIKCENIELKEKLKIEKEKYIQQQKYIIELQTSITDKNMIGKNDEFINSLKANLESSRLELQKLSSEFEKANLNEEKYVMKIEMLESKLSKNENEKKRIAKQLEDNSKNNLINFNKLKTNLDILTEENRILLLNKEEYEKEIEELKRDNQFFNSTKNNDLNIIEKEKLQEQVSEYLNKLNEKDKEIINLNFQIRKLTNENADMKNKINLSNENNDNSNNDIDNKSNENISLEIYKYINENIDLTAELENKNELIDKCKEEIKQKNDEINKLNDEILKLSKNCNKLNESISIMERHKANMNNHIKEKDEIIEQLKNKYNNRLDDLLNSYSYKANSYPWIENGLDNSSDDILKIYKNITADNNIEINTKEAVANLNSLILNKENDNIIIIKCNILKLFKLGSCYLYIINRNLKEIHNLKNQVSCLEQSIESLNQFIDNLKNENNKNEIIKVNNLEEIIKLKSNLKNNESFINNLKEDIKKNEENNEKNLKSIHKYESFIIHLIEQSTVFCEIFKNINAKKKINPSILNQLSNLQKSFNFYMYDSIIEEFKNKNNIHINNDFTEEDVQNIRLFTENFNSKIEKGETELFNKIESNEDQDVSSFKRNIFNVDYNPFNKNTINEDYNTQKKRKYTTNENEFIKILLNEEEFINDKEQNNFNQIDTQLCKKDNKESEKLNLQEKYKKNSLLNEIDNTCNEKNKLNECNNSFIDENEINKENNIFNIEKNEHAKENNTSNEINNEDNKEEKNMIEENRKLDKENNIENNSNKDNEELKNHFTQNRLECKTSNETLQRYEENILENFYRNNELIQKESECNNKDVLNYNGLVMNKEDSATNNENNFKINDDNNIVDDNKDIRNNNDNLINRDDDIINEDNKSYEKSNYFNVKESEEQKKNKGLLDESNDKKIDNKYINENVISTAHSENKDNYCNFINTNENHHIKESEYNHNLKENEKNILENLSRNEEEEHSNETGNCKNINTIENRYNQNEDEENSENSKNNENGEKNKNELCKNLNDTYIVQNNNSSNINSYSSHVSEYNCDIYKKGYEENNKMEKKRKYYSDSGIVKIDYYSPTSSSSRKIKKMHNLYIENEENENEFKNEKKEINENEECNEEENQEDNNDFNSLNYNKENREYEEKLTINKLKESNNCNNYYEMRTNNDMNDNNENIENYEFCESENNENESSKSCYIISSGDECEKNDYSRTSNDEEEGDEDGDGSNGDEVNEENEVTEEEDYEEDNTKEIDIDKDENEEDNEEEIEEECEEDNSKEAEMEEEDEDEEENEEDMEEEEYEEGNYKEAEENEDEEYENEEYENEENSRELDEEKDSEENEDEDDEYEIKENYYEEQEDNLIYGNQHISNLNGNSQKNFNMNKCDTINRDHHSVNVNVNNDDMNYGNFNKNNNANNNFNFFTSSNKKITKENESFNANEENSDAISIESSNEENELYYENEKENVEDTNEKNNLNHQENLNSKENK